jgi:hypothetical protein
MQKKWHNRNKQKNTLMNYLGIIVKNSTTGI